MLFRSSQHLKTCCTPYPATVSDLYNLEQEAEETLRHYIWRFRGVVDRIIPKYLCEASVIAQSRQRQERLVPSHLQHDA